MSTYIKDTSWEVSLTERLNHLKSMDLHRKLRPIEDATKPFLTYEGKTMFNLSSNNYLGIANHPDILRGIRTSGAGAGSSRLVIGHDHTTAALEKEIALHKNTEAALLFSNGYMMNIGVLSSLLNSSDVVLSDQYNHASIVDGIRLSGAIHYRYRHNNIEHLENLLKKANKKGIKRKLIVTETVFSMDGDIAPLPDIVFLKNKYGASLIIDEAHGDGVFGIEGEGIAHHLGLENEVDLHMGTFSKAYGLYGAYVAGNKKWIHYLIHTCRSLIYTTALPPCIVQGVRNALHLVKESVDLRKMLAEKSNRFHNSLLHAGFHTRGETQIIPLIIGDEAKTLAFSKRLYEKNILGVAIRPPTVPKGSSRIRFTLMANHENTDLEQAITTITSIGHELGVIS